MLINLGKSRRHIRRSRIRQARDVIVMDWPEICQLSKGADARYSREDCIEDKAYCLMYF